MFLSTFIFIVTLLLTLTFILTSKKSIEESRGFFYAMPTELLVATFIIITISLSFTARAILRKLSLNTYSNAPINIYIYILIIYCNSIALFTSLSSKYIDGSLTPVAISTLTNNIKDGDASMKPSTLFIFIYIPIILFIFISIYLIYLCSILHNNALLAVGILLLFSTIGFIIYLLIIHDSFNKSLSIQIKSNEMRTSLISNVSHDIKTPLTSILNYTSLMTHEVESPTENFRQNLEQYAKVIINKSNRLNDLINDLIFDSKVSSGNLELEMSKIDVNAFLVQVIQEFEDKLKEKELKILFENKSTNSIINADGTQLYRVFQNLFSNIYKYSLENSRVYIDLENSKRKLYITMKNIQKEKLEVNVESLTDRFVRGNKSRTTEGFGLGLSIAENLIKSMGGKLTIYNKRDEFISKIVFLTYEE